MATTTRHFHLLLVVATLSILAAPSASGGQVEHFALLPGGGHVLAVERLDRDGIALFPGRFENGEAKEVLDPAGFSVHLVNADDPSVEMTFPAGRPFAPPQGRWRLWMQGPGSMTPYSALRVFHAPVPKGYLGVDVVPVEPAGRIALPTDFPGGQNLELRLLRGEEVRVAGFLRHELSRRYPLDGSQAHALMPEGKALAAVWNRSEKRYVALSRLFSVVPDEVVTPPLMRPAEDAVFLVVNVFRPPVALSDWLPGLELSVRVGGVEHPADVIILDAWGAYGTWYNLGPGRAVLEGGNDRLYLEPRSLQLRGGFISRVVQELSPRPFLDHP